MEKVTKNFEEIVTFSNEALAILESGVSSDKLKYALIKLVGDPTSQLKGKLAAIFKQAQKESIKLQIEYASTDDRGNLLMVGPNSYQYTKDNKLALNAALDDLAMKEYEFEPHYVTEEDCNELTEAHKHIFKDFIIK